MISEKFVILAALINFGGSLSYVRATLSGKARPNRVTWSLWALAPLIAFAAEVGQGVGLIALMTFITGFNPLMVLTASFINKKAYWRLTKFDYICGGLALVGLALWAITRQGNMAILFSILADGLAAIPTVVKAYKDPGSEYALAYIVAGVSALVTLLSIHKWTFENWGFPLYILVICGLIATLLKFQSKKLSTKNIKL